MATVTSTRTSAGVTPGGLRIGLFSETATFSANGSMSSGDVIQMVKIPANAQVVSIATHYALSGVGSVVVGDGVSTNRYVVATAASAGIACLNFPGTIASYVPYTYSTDDTIDVVLSSSVNVSSGAIYMQAVWRMVGPTS